MSTFCSACGGETAKLRRGWCPPCYMRWRRAGRPDTGPPPSTRWWERENATAAQELAGTVPEHLLNLASRFWPKVHKRGPDECWPWTRAVNEHGYGVMRPTGKRSGPTVKAHRVALMVTGRDPGRRIVRHSCDNPPCCNPRHLLLGTKADNSADMVERGRSPWGTRSATAKLTESHVLEIRALMASGARRKDVAAQFGVSPAAITHIVKRETWAHLPEAVTPNVAEVIVSAPVEAVTVDELERSL